MQSNLPQNGTSFQIFLSELDATGNPLLTGIRHELYFIAVRNGQRQSAGRQTLRAVLALIRSLKELCWRSFPALPSGPADGPVNGLAVASLPGANGWQSLLPLIRQGQAAGLTLRALWHPRLKGTDAAGIPVHQLPRPRLRDGLAAAAQCLRMLRQKNCGPVPAAAAAATLLRSLLWQSAWRRLGATVRAPLLLHNDFDMMNAASRASGMPHLVLQHGIPTDEFFPCFGTRQIVWGESSAAGYAPHLPPGGRAIPDGLGRRERLPAPSAAAAPPQAAALISQTHTPIFGPGLRERLLSFAAESGNGPLTVLLHPAEGAAPGPYMPAPGLTVRAAPHPLLSAAAPPMLIAGFCSTALIDAALCGHYVVGLDWPLPGSETARRIARPPAGVGSFAELHSLLHRLQNDATARERHRQQQHDWLKTLFAPTGQALAEWLELSRS